MCEIQTLVSIVVVVVVVVVVVPYCSTVRRKGMVLHVLDGIIHGNSRHSNPIRTKSKVFWHNEYGFRSDETSSWSPVGRRSPFLYY